MKVIATNGFLNIVDIKYGIIDFVVLDDGTQCDIWDSGNELCFSYNNEVYYLNDFIRTNI